MEVSKKIMLFCLFFLIILALSGCGKVYTNTDDYQNYLSSLPGSTAVMPDLSEISNFQSYEIYYYERLGQSINLLITYSDEAYQTAKETALGAFTFLDTPLMENDYYLIPETEFEYDGFTIKVVDDDNFDYPEKFGMIGYSDTEHQISYLFFYDDSLNRLGDGYSMQDFLGKEFWFPEE